MQRHFARLSILALSAAMAAGIVVGALAAGKPAVRVTQYAPLTVHGTGFHAREAVSVRVSMADAGRVAMTRTDLAGRFTVRFATDYNPCAAPLRVVARGARTGVVYLRLPIAECAVP